MDDCTHVRVCNFFKLVCSRKRPLKVLQDHYHQWVIYYRNHLALSKPTEDLALIRRGFLAVLREDGGICWDFSENTLFVAVISYGDEFHLFHGDNIEILMAALGSNKVMMGHLFEIAAHVKALDGRRLIVAYVVAPWYANACEIACELRCTRVDGSSDSEAFASKNGRMILDVPEPVTMDCGDLNSRLGRKMKEQFSSHRLAPMVNSHTPCPPKTDQDMVPRALYKTLLEDLEDKRRHVANITQQLVLLRKQTPIQESYQESDIVPKFNTWKAKLRAEHKLEMENLIKKHKVELEKQRHEAAEATEGAIKILERETSPKKGELANLRRHVATLTHELEYARKQHQQATLDFDTVTEKNTQLTSVVGVLTSEMSAIKSECTEQTAYLLCQFETTLEDLHSKYENILPVRMRYQRVRVALLTYLRRECAFRERHDMKQGVMRTRMKHLFATHVTIQQRRIEELIAEKCELVVDKCTLKEMVSDCDIDIFTLVNKIKDIRRANMEYLRHVIKNKRQKNDRFRPAVDPTSRALINQFKYTHGIGATVNPLGFFYPIRPQSDHEPSSVSVHYHRHHHHHLHMESNNQD